MNSFVSDPGSQFSKISNSPGEAGAIDETLLFVYLLKLSKLPLSAEILMLQCSFFYVIFQEKAKKKIYQVVRTETESPSSCSWVKRLRLGRPHSDHERPHHVNERVSLAREFVLKHWAFKRSSSKF